MAASMIDDRGMRIAYFTDWLPPARGPVSVALARTADALRDRVIDFRFLCPDRPDETRDWRDKVHQVRRWRGGEGQGNGFPLPGEVAAALDPFRPTLVHLASDGPLGLAGLRYAWARALPVVSSYHAHWPLHLRQRGHQRLERAGWHYLRWFHSRCLSTYVPSPSAAEELRGRGFERLELWERGVDVPHFSPTRRDPALREAISARTRPVVLYVGRLAAEKGVRTLVRAAHLLSCWGNSFKLVIVGDGPLREEVARRLPGAHLPGEQSGEALARWYASADVFATASTVEACGSAVREAFASGIPAVGVRSGALADLIIPERNGLLARPGSAIDLARQLERLLRDAGMRARLGAEAMRSRSLRSWEAATATLLDSYERALRSPARAHPRTARFPLGRRIEAS